MNKPISILLITLLTGCLTTTEVYETAREINDNSFATATKVFCGYTSSFAANRQLTDGEILKRHEFCELYRARQLE